jgi:hypothetical protein
VGAGSLGGMERPKRKVVTALPGDGWQYTHGSDPENRKPLLCWLVWSDGWVVAVVSDCDGATSYVDPLRGDYLLFPSEGGKVPPTRSGSR